MTLGIASFGRSFALADEQEHDYGAPCKSDNGDCEPGEPGLLDHGTLSYFEVCEKLNSGWRNEIIGDVDVYAHGDGEWVGYDNEWSTSHKMHLAKVSTPKNAP